MAHSRRFTEFHVRTRFLLPFSLHFGSRQSSQSSVFVVRRPHVSRRTVAFVTPATSLRSWFFFPCCSLGTFPAVIPRDCGSLNLGLRQGRSFFAVPLLPTSSFFSLTSWDGKACLLAAKLPIFRVRLCFHLSTFCVPPSPPLVVRMPGSGA